MVKNQRRYTDLGPIDGYVLMVSDKKKMDQERIGKTKTIQESKKMAIKYLIAHKSAYLVDIDRYWTHDGYGDKDFITKPSGYIIRSSDPNKFGWTSYPSYNSFYLDKNGKRI